MRAPRAFKYAPYCVATALVLASIAAACSLNPQPIPPGEQPGDASGAGSENPTLGDADGATTLTDDGGTTGVEAGIDSGPMPPPQDAGTDAADAADAADASDAADAHD